MTVVHDPDDARIRYRQLTALLAAGVEVTYAAPFEATHRRPPEGVEAVELPRAAGRQRFTAISAARRLLHRIGPEHDLVLLHDPELLLAVPGLDRRRPPQVVWDVHEDTAAALRMKSWLPRPVRPLTGAAVRAAERWAERRCRLLLAEEGYRDRFRLEHPVVPNSVPVPDEKPPPPGDRRVVYLGRITRARGALEMIELGRRLGPEVAVELIGPADGDVAGPIAHAHAEGWITHHGFVPNREALGLLPGALAGLALLHDEPNYAVSRPTKVMEYMAFGVPVVTTPNAAAAELVGRYRSGTVVPFADVDAAESAIRALRDDAARRERLGSAGWNAARADLDWRADGRRFAELIRDWSRSEPARSRS
ncbi:glycosyltransferase family 4 protein [Kineosporia succinea]|uniref:Glycosyltransferase involved in cell wall biosynthesis n=1 Tax=Kineosporia succinea TaxID=84632 RepID=A0ABT9NYC5_9ACTN|nr:glycosyltransferase family 4 protein [Kineosporia succinea]MDP9825426.1 glycosyltransferase involved in cell wall biosynthesis [Kineosporia succinea]